MKDDSKKSFSITEYSVIVCLLILKIWCGFFNQALLFGIGGALSGIIDFVLIAYIFVNIRRLNSNAYLNAVTYKFLVIFLFFLLIYALVFALGWDYLPQESFLGFIQLPKHISTVFFSVIYMSALILIVKNLKEHERKSVSDFIILVFFLVAILNLITSILNPELVKNESYNEGTSLFTLGYSGSYNLMLFTPILLYKAQTSDHKLMFTVLIICNIVSIFYGGYFIAILGTLVALAMYAILSIKNKFVVMLWGSLFVVLLISLILSGALADVMYYLADNIEIDVISRRCLDVAKYFSGDTKLDTGDTTFRIFIYQDTFEHFLNHPILGNYIYGNYDCQWDHATILDLLSTGGIVLGGLFFAMLTMGYKCASAFLTDYRAKRALLASVIAYIFIASINSVLSYKLIGILFTVAPIIMGGESKYANTNSTSL